MAQNTKKFCNPALANGILLQPILPLGSIVVDIYPLGFYNIDSVKPSILWRDFERMDIGNSIIDNGKTSMDNKAPKTRQGRPR